MSIPGMAGMLGHIRSGKLRALAVTSARRAPQLIDVPTVTEAGVPGYEAYVWMGLLARGRPTPVVSLYRPRDALIAVRPVPNRSYAPARRIDQSFQFGTLLIAAKSRANGSQTVAAEDCAGSDQQQANSDSHLFSFRGLLDDSARDAWYPSWRRRKHVS